MTRTARIARPATPPAAAELLTAAFLDHPFTRHTIDAVEHPAGLQRGRQRIQATVESLTQQSKDLVAAAQAVASETPAGVAASDALPRMYFFPTWRVETRSLLIR